MPTRIDRDELQSLLNEGAQLIEVLPREEYDEAHLPGAISLPLGELTPDSASQLDQTRPVITYCYDYACDLSPRAAWRLESMGFQRVHHYVGGKADWMAAGLPIEGSGASIATVGRIARSDVPTCALSTPVGEVRKVLASSWSASCFVVNDERIVLGRIYRSRLKDAGEDRRADQVMDPGPVTFRPDITVDEMAQRMRDDELRTAPITTSEGQLLGLVLRDDVERLARGRRQPINDEAGTGSPAST